MKTATKQTVIKDKKKGFDWSMILVYAIFPFYYLWRWLNWVGKGLSWIFFDTIETGNNGIYGPGYRSYFITKFSWGKLSFIISLIILILILIYII